MRTVFETRWTWSAFCLVIFARATSLSAAEASASDATQSSDLNGLAGQAVWLLGGYCVLIVAASLFGGWLSHWIHLTHTRMQTLVSGVGGFMLGIAIFHLWPHSVQNTGSLEISGRWIMAGLLTMFFLIRLFHHHHHGPAEPQTDDLESHGHSCRDHGHSPAHHLSWVGVTLGLAVHTLIDGLALGASVRADLPTDVRFSLFGFATFLAIFLHKPLDAVSITSLMAAGGWTPFWRNVVNAGFAMMCPLGAVLFLFGADRIAADQTMVIGCALAFSAGVFLCISLGDLLPELELHSHHRLRLSSALLCGVFLAWAIEQGHTHPPRTPVRNPQAIGFEANPFQPPGD